ncbi:sensor histidine kinase [Clostridium sp. Marseille-P2415]|uniref:sensor histidine kinase n=1 Tax=Clostridium sp. Marseille-P2415 TaxID=1805471 RepID=UPI0009885A15|nr:histidine kinase [Clostridium sp. Marseille-P2415]
MMKTLIRRINSSITKKILFLIAVSIGASFLVSLFVVKKVEQSYANYVYETKTDILNSSMSGIEDKLSGYENSTYQFITGNRVQQLVSQLLNSYDTLDELEGSMEDETGEELPSLLPQKKTAESLKTDSLVEIMKELDTYLASTHKTDAGYFVDSKGRRYSGYGGTKYDISEDVLQEIVSEAAEKRGSPAYKVIDIRRNNREEYQQEIVIARSIQEKRNMTMRYGGTVIYMISPGELAASYLTDRNGLFLVDEKDGVVFSSMEEPEKEAFLKKVPLNIGKYAIVRLNGNKYFITSIKSEKLNWRYYNVSNYYQLFSFIQNLDIIYSMVLLTILVVIGLLASHFSITLVKPVVTLSEQIEAVKREENPVKALEHLKIRNRKKRYDEIGHLEEKFSEMICQLSELIHENYEQKLYLQDAQLSALRSKLNPHFLYNTLDTIRWMANEEKYRQIPMVVKALGDILRISMKSKEALIPLEQELEYMRGYLTIQRARFGSRLNVQIEAEEDLMKICIPAFSLQPLVENAVNYALERMTRECRIHVVIADEGRELLCSVSDNGVGIDPNILDKLKLGTLKAEGNGVGLTNLNERLKSLYGPGYGIIVKNSCPGGAVICFRVKKEVSDRHEVN